MPLPVAQAEEGRTVAAAAGDRAGDRRQRAPALAAPEEAGLDDMHLVALAPPVADQPGARQQPRGGRRLRSRDIDRAARREACPRARQAAAAGRDEPPWTAACQCQAMPSISSRRRAPFGGGAPQASDQAWRRSPIGISAKAAIRSVYRMVNGGAGCCAALALVLRITPPGPDDRPCGRPVLARRTSIAALAETGEGGAGGMRQPSRGGGQVIERRALGPRDRRRAERRACHLAARGRRPRRSAAPDLARPPLLGCGWLSTPIAVSPAA